MTISQLKAVSKMGSLIYCFYIWNHNFNITKNSTIPDTGTSRFLKLSMPILNNTIHQDIKQKLEGFYKEEFLFVLKLSWQH